MERLLFRDPAQIATNRFSSLFPPSRHPLSFGCLVAVDNSAPGATFCQAVTTHLTRPTAIDGDWNLKIETKRN